MVESLGQWAWNSNDLHVEEYMSVHLAILESLVCFLLILLPIISIWSGWRKSKSEICAAFFSIIIGLLGLVLIVFCLTLRNENKKNDVTIHGMVKNITPFAKNLDLVVVKVGHGDTLFALTGHDSVKTNQQIDVDWFVSGSGNDRFKCWIDKRIALENK